MSFAGLAELTERNERSRHQKNARDQKDWRDAPRVGQLGYCFRTLFGLGFIFVFKYILTIRLRSFLGLGLRNFFGLMEFRRDCLRVVRIGRPDPGQSIR